MKRAWKPAAALAACLAACLNGCFQDKIAGGSSEVDNPVTVAFVDAQGASLMTSGTVSVYLAGQNPALDPYPLVARQFTGKSSLQLTAQDFTQGLASANDSAISYNILFIGDDSTGSLLQNLTYDPATRRYTLGAATVTRVVAPVAPLVRYEASLRSDDSGLVRVFIPGTPFQSVVVDSSFVLTGVPQGTFSLRVLGGDGSERPLKPAQQGPGGGNHHQIDSTAPPFPRPNQPAPAQPLKVFAGNDASLSATSGGGGPTTYSLFGSVEGANPTDPRLGVKWRQIGPGPQGAKAAIESPTALNTHVSFPRSGAYQFTLSAVLGSGGGAQRVEDTVLIVIEAPLGQPVFKTPTAGDTLYIWEGDFHEPPEKIVWEGQKDDVLVLELSTDGANWHAISFPIASRRDLNTFDWYPEEAPSNTARLRLKNQAGEVVATSPVFQLRFRPDPWP